MNLFLNAFHKKMSHFVQKKYATLLLGGDKFYCPVCNTGYKTFLSAGVTNSRKNARCPGCNSLERHRLLSLVLDYMWSHHEIPKTGRLLHVAPEPAIANKLKKYYEYISADLDGTQAMVSMDITSIDLPDSTFDVIIANHVLEHIPNDRQALGELYRILKPGGWASIQVPLKGEITQEDLSIIDPKEREKLYGQGDHVRQYGSDFKYRLFDAGFSVLVFHKSMFDPLVIEKISVECKNEVWICQKV